MEVTITHVDYNVCIDELIDLRNYNRIEKRNRAYFNWRYINRPHKSKPQIIIARNQANELIGSVSIIPHHYNVKGESKLFGVVGDISVKKNYRRKGIATKLFNYIREVEFLKDIECLIVLPNTEAEIVLKKTGWQQISSINRYVRVLNFDYYINIKSKFKIFKNVFLTISNKFSNLICIQRKLAEIYSYKITDKLSSDFDNLWFAFDKSNFVGGLRNRSYLQWRYLDHPLIKYQIFCMYKKNTFCGYIVFHDDNKTVKIDDFFCADFKTDLRYLLGSFIEYTIKNINANNIYLRTNNNDFLVHNPIVFGFIKRKDKQNFLLFSFSDKTINESLKNSKLWFLTSGDKDV